MEPQNQTAEKLSPRSRSIGRMFDRIAPSYDRLNHLLSLGIDRLWRRSAVRHAAEIRPERLLDVATGTGDQAIALARRIEGCRVVGVDISEGMLEVARRKIDRAGLGERVELRAGCVEALPVAKEECFDAVTVSFGVRNFDDPAAGIRVLAEPLRPGGRLLILELSTPRNPLIRSLYGWYSRRVMPAVGGALSHERGAYNYLPASVEAFMSPARVVRAMEEAGLHDCRAVSKSFGIAHLYIGTR